MERMHISVTSHSELERISKNDKARVDEIDCCIATVINAPSAQKDIKELPPAQQEINSSEIPNRSDQAVSRNSRYAHNLFLSCGLSHCKLSHYFVFLCPVFCVFVLSSKDRKTRINTGFFGLSSIYAGFIKSRSGEIRTHGFLTPSQAP